ncbi:MAG: hypothetical protein ACYTGL_14725 [Planctomycetota bacterium]|jgi:hypothetical protein
MKGVDTGVVRKLYRNTGTFAAPVRVEVDNIGDLSKPAAWATAKSATRGRRRRRSSTTILDEGLNFTMEVDKSRAAEVANYEAFRSAFYDLDGNQTIDLTALDAADDVDGAQGLHAIWVIVGFEESEPLEGHVSINVSLEIATQDDGNDPEWITISNP